MQGGEQQHFRSRAVFFLLVSVMVFTPLSPMAGLFSSEAEAAAGTRHVYEFSDGSVAVSYTHLTLPTICSV